MVCGDGCRGAPSGGTVQQWCHPTWPTQVCTGPHHGGIHHVHCHVQPGRVQLLLLAAAAAAAAAGAVLHRCWYHCRRAAMHVCIAWHVDLLVVPPAGCWVRPQWQAPTWGVCVHCAVHVRVHVSVTLRVA